MSSCLISYVHDMNFTAGLLRATKVRPASKGQWRHAEASWREGTRAANRGAKGGRRAAPRGGRAAPRRGRASPRSCICLGGSEGPSKTTERNLKKTGADDPEDKSKH